MEHTEYWTTANEWTASGTRRFIEATLAPQHGRRNLKVVIDSDGEIVSATVVEPS